ncbi:virulence RhuM family protein [Flavobacterium covae]|uniref:virulence RhuM family protein n=1 Tax=Flavobacterium covae TaxID=2906076 RepID=UPI0035E3F75E
MSEIILYTTDDGVTKINVQLEDETVWLTIDQMAELFNKSRSTINEHIINIYTENELIESETMRKIGISDFSTKPTNFYNLDVIISVGYRVKSVQGTCFRQWATQRLKEYIVKGFTMDDDRLKNLGGGNYWKELLDRIRDIRSSEKVMYRQVLAGAGTISHNQAHDKAVHEYKKYKAKTLSSVEKDYLKTLAALEKIAKKQSRKK